MGGKALLFEGLILDLDFWTTDFPFDLLFPFPPNLKSLIEFLCFAIAQPTLDQEHQIRPLNFREEN